MSHTVIGIFDHTSEAQAAVSCLAGNGFDRENIDLSTRAEMENVSILKHEKPHAGIISFFSYLFGLHTDADKYSKVGQRGAIVTVHASCAEQAQSAAQILDKYDALDVHERAESDQNKNTDQLIENGIIIDDEQPEDHLKTPTDYVAVRSRIIKQVLEEEMRLHNTRIHTLKSQVDIMQQSNHKQK